MKITDDYRAKIQFWVKTMKVAPAPAPPKLPKFTGQKFRSHHEMNEWKSQLLTRLAREASD